MRKRTRTKATHTKISTLTPTEIHLLLSLLEKMGAVHKSSWGEAFVPFMSKVVPAAVELVIVRNGKVLLTHRRDAYFRGWHFPGTYLGPRET